MIKQQSIQDNLRKDKAKDSVFVFMMRMPDERSVVRFQHVNEETTVM